MEIPNLAKEFKCEKIDELAALDETVKTLRKSAPNELKKSVQAIITIFNNEFDVLA